MAHLYAIQKNFKLGPDGVPDATKDPEAYKEFLRAQVEREQQQKEEVEEEKKAVARQEAIMEQALQLRSEFQKKKELSNDGMKRFLDWVNETLGGNPKNGKLPTDLYDRLYIAYTHEEDVKKAEEKGKKEGRTEVVEAKMREKKADGLPHLATKKEIAPTVSSEMKWLADWLLVRGVDLLIPHAFYYSVRGRSIPRNSGSRSRFSGRARMRMAPT